VIYAWKTIVALSKSFDLISLQYIRFLIIHFVFESILKIYVRFLFCVCLYSHSWACC